MDNLPTSSSHIAGSAIGFSITASGTASALYTQGCINPARIFGPSIIVNKFAQPGAWVFYLGPSIAAVLASLVFQRIIVPGWSFLSHEEADSRKDLMNINIEHYTVHHVPAPLGLPLDDD